VRGVWYWHDHPTVKLAVYGERVTACHPAGYGGQSLSSVWGDRSRDSPDRGLTPGDCPRTPAEADPPDSRGDSVSADLSGLVWRRASGSHGHHPRDRLTLGARSHPHRQDRRPPPAVGRRDAASWERGCARDLAGDHRHRAPPKHPLEPREGPSWFACGIPCRDALSRPDRRAWRCWGGDVLMQLVL